MKNLFTIVLILICGHGLIAQSDFREGYIIKNNNDTIFGLIDYKGDIAISKKCTFRENINSKNQVFTPDDIVGFRFSNSKYFVSKSVDTDMGTKQLFLEYLINGTVDIYYYRDEIKKYYLVEDSLYNLYNLKNEEINILVDNIEYLRESKEYIGILKVIFNESPSISKKVETIKLNHKSLINIAWDYHNEVCSDKECIIYEKKLPKKKNTFGIVAGVNRISVSQIWEFPPNYSYFDNVEFNVKYFPSLGLYYKINLPFLSEKLYFFYQGIYSHIKLTASSSQLSLAQGTIHLNDFSIIQNTFNNLFILKHEFPKGKIKPTLQMGIFVKYLSTMDYKRDMRLYFMSSDTTVYQGQMQESPFDKADYGINFGMGLKSHSFMDREVFMELNYQRGFGFFESTNTNLFLINLAIQITK